ARSSGLTRGGRVSAALPAAARAPPAAPRGPPPWPGGAPAAGRGGDPVRAGAGTMRWCVCGALVVVAERPWARREAEGSWGARVATTARERTASGGRTDAAVALAVRLALLGRTSGAPCTGASPRTSATSVTRAGRAPGRPKRSADTPT